MTPAVDRHLEDHVRGLQAQVADHLDAITRAARAGEAELSVALYMADVAPVLNLPPDLVAWLASLGSSIDIDAYPWEPDPQ